MTEMIVKQGARAQGVRDALESHVTGSMHILTNGGDMKVTWNARDTDEVAQARQNFTDLRAKGFRAFKVAEGGRPGVQIDEFDPSAQKLIMVPPMAGGSLHLSRSDAEAAASSREIEASKMGQPFSGHSSGHVFRKFGVRPKWRFFWEDYEKPPEETVTPPDVVNRGATGV